jgi:outer membrane protein assembly factor BamD (BamD/ComL family)
MRNQPVLLGLAAVLALAPACATIASWLPGGPERIPKKLEANRVPHAIESAKAELDAGHTGRALQWMRAAAVADDLATETREQVQTLLEEVAGKRIEELSAPGADPGDLADLVDLDLPRQLAVTAGIQAARRMQERGEPMDAYRIIKKLDSKYPLHHERAEAGELLGDLGLALSKDHSHFLFFYNRQDDAQEVLEYLILNYPRALRCDEAYAALARIYTDERNWSLAIDRLEKLILNHPSSPRRPAGQAEIPHLRLRSIESPEYDRSAILHAKEELEEWLRGYPGSELEPNVRTDLADCLRRLSDSDLGIAGFYGRVRNGKGARWHAQRAVEEARQAGDEERAKRAEVFLEKFSPPPAPAEESGRAAGPQVSTGGMRR